MFGKGESILLLTTHFFCKILSSIDKYIYSYYILYIHKIVSLERSIGLVQERLGTIFVFDVIPTLGFPRVCQSPFGMHTC